MKKRLLIATGGGDCPGLNAVIRAIVKRAQQEPEWEILGSIDAFNGILMDPIHLVELTPEKVAGIHVQGGTIIGTTNQGGPFSWPVKNPDGSWTVIDRSADFMERIRNENIEAIINIGGDGSQRISQGLFELGCHIIGVPKTIDNDLSATDFTFGFQTAVDIATDAVDKLVTTAASHHRILILEVMGRYAGWIALHSSIAGGAEVCLIPEIDYDINSVIEALKRRTASGKEFANIVIAEGAKPKGGSLSYLEEDNP
ncbi:MAG TPA: ATP-dependent 6-phosphofructokinase, partial [Candidatus Syntrophosphaera thermopropionivorans]|nr:ATP-dependent 6-phosphofructokinase [Candidatus Syntrophosphaera thermopropionivorans]